MEVEILELEVPFRDPNSVFVYFLDSKILIDAGFCSIDNAERISELEPEVAVVTHHHVDHVGYLFFSEIPFYMHPAEIELVKIYEKPETFIDWQKEICRKYSISSEYLRPLEVLSKLRLRIRGSLKSSEELKLQTIVVPGHSPGHICVFADNALFSGDAILSETTPNLSFYPHLEAGLGEYLEALENIKRMDIEVIYPAHEKRIDDPTERIDALIEHYKERLREVLEILDEPLEVEEIARRVRWSVDYEKLDPLNRLLANLETLAYLSFLKSRGLVRVIQETKIKFFRTSCGIKTL